ncbi:MAG TPA: hypothetical protein VF812_15295 [Ktedonobacterales bacterium]
MRIRGFAAAAIAVVTVLALSLGVALPAGAAAPQQQSASATVTIRGKNTLPETSLGSPGFASRANSTVIAWTGTDPLHHLNVEKSVNGLTNYGDKMTLRETSIAGPAVAQMSEAAGSAVILAWTGTDPAHRLNVLFDVYGQQKKMTYSDTSFTSPAITIYKGNLLLAWAGTDPNHSLNVMEISLSSLGMLQRRTFVFGSNEGPSLATVDVEPSAQTGGTTVNEAVLGWTTKDEFLRFANSKGGLAFEAQPALASTSPFAPVMMQYHTEGGPEFWIAWTGTDPAHHLNVRWTTPAAFPNITGTKTILPELAFGHPGIGFNNGLFVAWTGTDPAHHLNVAEFEGF